MRENPELLSKIKQIQSWIQEKHAEHSDDGLLYSSVDVRESSFKIAPVDINLFPSGFNNFSCEDLSARFHFITKKFAAQRVGLLVENFTRNQKYLANIENLKNALLMLNMSVTLMTIRDMKVIKFSLDESIIESVDLEEFDLIICNNDLSLGCPKELLDIEHKVLPSSKLGWYNRKKHVHLGIYNDLVYRMVKDLNLSIDPWYLTTFLSRCDNVDFRHKNGLEMLADKVDMILQKISQKYLQYQISDCEPHVFIKANNGTFGMGIMVAKSAHDILNINKKSRHSISVLKQGIDNVDVIVQEGIHTNIKIFDAPAENILYSIGNIALNKLMRFNREKSIQSNLNSTGMEICLGNELDMIDDILLKLANLSVKIEKKEI